MVEYSLMTLGSGSESQLTVSHARINNQYTHGSVLIQPFCFSFSIEYILHEISNTTLHYKIGFMLDDFAQVQTNVKCSEHV